MNKPIIALLGNPNSGKTTLLNALTGRQKAVGNWSGVTVTQYCSEGSVDNIPFEMIDLPGTYSLTVVEDDTVHDESLPSAFLKQQPYTWVLNVVDAIALERHLYVTLQALEQQLPMVVLINREDLLHAQGKTLSCEMLSAALGCPVIARESTKTDDKAWLKPLLLRTPSPSTFQGVVYPQPVEQHIKALCEQTQQPRWQVVRWLEGEKVQELPIFAAVQAAQESIAAALDEAADVIIAKCRYDFIAALLQKMTQAHPATKPMHQAQSSFSEKCDSVLCHRWWGLPCFFAIMYALFFFAVGMGGHLQTVFESIAQFIFIDRVSQLLTAMSAPIWLTTMLVKGIGEALTTLITFIPVIGAMFLALSFLEESGYMARAAFVMDKFMRAVGLPGKSFVPMIIGFGCNVPAILGTRTLDNRRDRVLAVMMSPFMSCGARLAIFTVFVAAFFPKGGQNIVFLLYLIGITMAIVTGLLLKKTLLRGANAPFLLEMPRFQWPQTAALARMTWHRLSRFLLNAGKLIIPVCIVIALCNESHGGESVLSWIGQWLVPIFKPMGIEASNWPAAVGLLTGLMAKEVVIGTLNALYATPGDLVTQFHGQASAFAYLLFVLLYSPCMSATAAMLREVQKGWTIFSLCWTTGLAYGIAVGFYQCATFAAHPLQSLIWLSILAIAGIGTWMGIRAYSRAYLWHRVPTRVVLRS